MWANAQGQEWEARLQNNNEFFVWSMKSIKTVEKGG